MTSRVAIVVRCEDREHLNFIVEVLELLGHSRKKLDARPVGDFDHVRAAFEREVPELRVQLQRGRANHALIALIDADTDLQVDRKRWLEERLADARRPGEPIALLVPRRNIETWLRRLSGEDLVETNALGVPVDYSGGAAGERARRRPTVRAAAREFVTRFRASAADAAVPSLADAMAELRRVPHHRGAD